MMWRSFVERARVGLAATGPTATFALVALSSCQIDERTVTVHRECRTPATDGLIADFSTARLGSCPAQTCEGALAGSTTVTLGTGPITGLVYPYRIPEPGVLALGLTGDLELVHDDAASLRVVVGSALFLGPEAPSLVAGFALRFTDCLNTGDFSALAFTSSGSFGDCPLRFAVQYEDAAPPSSGTPCPIEECFTTSSVPVVAGRNTLQLSRLSGIDSRALIGVQWEMSAPSTRPTTCGADFTVDDIELLAAP